MNLNEFRAWFEGYTEEMQGPPSREQWKKIKAKVRKIEDNPTSWPIFVDRYVRRYEPYWTLTSVGGGTYQSASNCAQSGPERLSLDSNAAFKELGRIEARAEAEA